MFENQEIAKSILHIAICLAWLIATIWLTYSGFRLSKVDKEKSDKRFRYVMILAVAFLGFSLLTEDSCAGSNNNGAQKKDNLLSGPIRHL